jgi:heme/copper-type cytochrome/quinol oxidase subunit 2
MKLIPWLGLFVAPAAWFGQHAVGQAIAQASCSAADASWGLSNRTWQIVLLVVASVLILGAEAAAVASFRRTEPATYEDPAPAGRVQLIAVAAMTTNLIYLVIVLLDGIASIVGVQCRQS